MLHEVGSRRMASGSTEAESEKAAPEVGHGE